MHRLWPCNLRITRLKSLPLPSGKHLKFPFEHNESLCHQRVEVGWGAGGVPWKQHFNDCETPLCIGRDHAQVDFMIQDSILPAQFCAGC